MKNFVVLCLLGAAFTLPAIAQETDNTPEVLEDESKIPPYTLPVLLTTESGVEIKTAEEWEKLRRPELYQLFADHMYGRMPEGEVEKKFTVVDVDKNYADGQATHKTVEITMSREGKSKKATLHLYLPNDAEQVPVFMFFVGELRGPAPFLLNLLKAGYGFCSGDYNDFFPDRGDDPTVYGESVLGLWGYETESDLPKNCCRALGVWAWGQSCALDYLETDEDVDAGRVIVMGHSRGGKQAAWAAATDKRFAMAVISQSGCGGASLFRRKIGETAYFINRAFPYWFCENFHQYDSNEDSLPVDQHELIALIAPRPVYVASGAEFIWTDPKGEFLSVAFADEVFNLYGYKGLDTMEQPDIDTPVGDRSAYHVRMGPHIISDYDWERYIEFADKWLKK